MYVCFHCKHIYHNIVNINLETNGTRDDIKLVVRGTQASLSNEEAALVKQTNELVSGLVSCLAPPSPPPPHTPPKNERGTKTTKGGQRDRQHH